jgi:hypothetical protein
MLHQNGTKNAISPSFSDDTGNLSGPPAHAGRLRAISDQPTTPIERRDDLGNRDQGCVEQAASFAALIDLKSQRLP